MWRSLLSKCSIPKFLNRSYCTVSEPTEVEHAEIHPWKKAIIDNFPQTMVVKESKMVIGRSKDHYWHSPYLKKLFQAPFPKSHAQTSTLLNIQGVEDLKKLAGICYRHDIPVVVRAGGVGVTAGAFNFGGGVVADIAQMNHILDLDCSKGTVKCEPGISMPELRQAVLSKGWDLRQFPTQESNHPSTLGGFLQTSKYGMGSYKFGSLLTFGNVCEMEIVKLTEDASVVNIDGVLDRKLMTGVLHSLGTSAIVSSVTIPLTAAQYWVDVGISFEHLSQAWNFLHTIHTTPSYEVTDLSMLPSSLVTYSLNFGERKGGPKFLKNRIPSKGHETGTIEEPPMVEVAEGPVTLPDQIQETEHVILLRINESALPFMNSDVKMCGGHTIYMEHARGGFSRIEDTLWQQAAIRLNKFFSTASFLSYELDLGSLSRMQESIDIEKKMEIVNNAIRQSIKPHFSNPNYQDESFLLRNDVTTVPSWVIGFAKNDTGSLDAIAQVMFRTQNECMEQMEERLNFITSAFKVLQRTNILNSFVNPNHWHPDKIFYERKLTTHRLEAKAIFDPKQLLNTRLVKKPDETQAL